MHYDITSKKILDISIGYFFERFLYIRPERIEYIERLPQEVFSSHRVDYPVKVHIDGKDYIYLFEVQSFWDERKLVDLAIYKLSFYKSYEVPTKVILVLLTGSRKVKDTLDLGDLYFRFELIKVYEYSAEFIVMNRIRELYPLVPVMRDGLRYVDSVVEEIEGVLSEEKMIEIYDMLIIILGLRDKEKSSLLYKRRRRIMIESPIIDEIMKEGIEKGIEQGIQKGIEQGIQKGIEQGIEQGKVESKIEIARRMIGKQKTLEEICEFLDCSIEDLRRWGLIN